MSRQWNPGKGRQRQISEPKSTYKLSPEYAVKFRTKLYTQLNFPTGQLQNNLHRQASIATAINPSVNQNSAVRCDILKPLLKTSLNTAALTVIFNEVFVCLSRRKQSVKWICDTKFIKRTAKITELIGAPLHLFNESEFLVPWITSQATEATAKDRSTPCQNLYSAPEQFTCKLNFESFLSLEAH